MRLGEQYLETWRRLDNRGRWIIVIAAALFLGGLILFVHMKTAGAYVPLYTRLSAEDAGQIVEKLKAEKIPYQLKEGGTVILVPEDKVYELRVALAKQGLPAAGQVGFEIFDRSGLPGTQFSNKVNYQRALQGELSRTISAMEEIASARVHLVLPEENLFAEKTPARASVVVAPRGGGRLDRETCRAIAHIVASAVQELTPENVTIVDNSGRVLYGPESAGNSPGMSTAQFELQQDYEDRLCASLQSMLDAVLGPHLSVVRVKAQLDFDAEEIKSESVRPVAGGRGLVTSEKVREEQYRGSGGERGGPVGAAANLGLSTLTQAPGENGSYVQREETREYEYSKQISSLIKAPGKIKSLAIAAIIDESLPAAATEQVRQLLQAAAGADSTRGDVITVQRMKMQTAEAAKAEQEAAVAAERRENTQRLLQTALRSGLSLAATALIFMSIFMAVRQLRQPLPLLSSQTEASGSIAPRMEGSHAEQSADDTSAPPDLSSLESPPSTPASINEIAPSEWAEAYPTAIRERLREMTKEDAHSIAEGILGLLHEERS